MFKLEHHEAIVLIQVIEANTFEGKDILMIAKILEKIHREKDKTAPDKDKWVEGGDFDGKK